MRVPSFFIFAGRRRSGTIFQQEFQNNCILTETMEKYVNLLSCIRAYAHGMIILRRYLMGSPKVFYGLFMAMYGKDGAAGSQPDRRLTMQRHGVIMNTVHNNTRIDQGRRSAWAEQHRRYSPKGTTRPEQLRQNSTKAPAQAGCR